MTRSPAYFASASEIAEKIIERAGPNLVLALPLGLGKANLVANALYDGVSRRPELTLTILTGLTLEKPRYGNLLEQRFLEPIIERLFGDYPDLHYARDRRAGRLPVNIRVEEFFFLAASQLGNSGAQQDYICANYTHVIPILMERGVNVLAQMVAPHPDGDSFLSLSCNTDLSNDLLASRSAGQCNFIAVGEVNPLLPYMTGEAEVADSEFDLLLRGSECRYSLFAPPKEPVANADYAAGLHIARLIPDGGTLQIGIGGIGDAVIHSLLLRQRDNPLFRQLVTAIETTAPVPPEDHREVFVDGLHGVSEMLVDGFLHLMDGGILTREVAGKVLYGGFFLGPAEFYRRLREMDGVNRDKIAMCSVAFANELYGDEAFKKAQRGKARFVNKAMMATLLGEVVSDGLADGRVVSGVGGQYNFAAQAFALADARSIITLPSTRETGGRVESNIRWRYANTTIPRHLRDIVVTEYGVADLRGKTDGEVIAAMVNISDSRFQGELLNQAKAAGKIAADYTIPTWAQDNLPDKIDALFNRPGVRERFPGFPLGTDFSEDEQRLLEALTALRRDSGSKWKLTRRLARGIGKPADEATRRALTRMALDHPSGLRERLYRWLLIDALTTS